MNKQAGTTVLKDDLTLEQTNQAAAGMTTTETTEEDDDLAVWLDRLIDFVNRHPEFEGQPYGNPIFEAMAKELNQ